MNCKRCGVKNSKEYQMGETYKGIDFHHNPPEFMFEENCWKGDLIPLCRDCHVWIHKEIKLIMFKYSNLFKFVNQEDGLWKHIIGEKRKECIKEIKLLGESIINGNP